MPSEYEARRTLVSFCLKLYERQLIVATDGNLSCRLGNDRFLTTPSGVCKGEVQPDQLVVVDGHGRKVAGRLNPSSEFAMHAAIYARRAEVGAIVHAHPPLATAFSVAGRSLEEPILTEVVLMLGGIPTAPYALPGSEAVARGAAEALGAHDACLLSHHGAVTVGRDLAEAYYRMETVEQTAKVALAAAALGGARALTPGQVGDLLEVRRAMSSRPARVSGQ